MNVSPALNRTSLCTLEIVASVNQENYPSGISLLCTTNSHSTASRSFSSMDMEIDNRKRQGGGGGGESKRACDTTEQRKERWLVKRKKVQDALQK